MEHQAGIIAAAAQWSNEQGSVIYEGVDVRLVKKDWNPAVMGLCELDEWFSFENYADFLFFWFTPGTDFDCEEEAPSLSKVRDTSKWAAAGHPGRVAWVSDGATAFDSVTGTCAARNVGVVIHAGMPWGSQGEELPQFAKGKLSLQQTVSHELTHVLLGHQHLGPSGDDYMQALLDAATTSTDLRSMCPDPWADHATYKQLSLLTGIYPSGGDPGWAVGGQGLGPSARVDPHAYTCLSNLYDDDPSGTFTNLMLYRWKPQGTPSGTEDPLEAWTSHATVDPSRWVADENLLATAEGANLEPIVAAKVTDIAGATDVKVRCCAP
ncbi:MAG: hypothetical protein KTR31_08500 [Myxococcales bacterium]|nr:hypothetical protein [Myxococcales bacterium]